AKLAKYGDRVLELIERTIKDFYSKGKRRRSGHNSGANQRSLTEYYSIDKRSCSSGSSDSGTRRPTLQRMAASHQSPVITSSLLQHQPSMFRSSSITEHHHR
ncbi:hypothetical protein MKX03_024998, partial [Papaver bracteatum]